MYHNMVASYNDPLVQLVPPAEHCSVPTETTFSSNASSQILRQ